MNRTARMHRRFGTATVGTVALIVVLVVVSVAAYEASMSSSEELTSSSSGLQLPSGASVLRGNMTVIGKVAGIPCGSLRLPCVLPTNQSSVSAALIRYAGNYYYVSFLSTNNIRYTIWYDNSSYYCISPKVQWANSCPGP